MKRVLIVEDEPRMRRVVQILVEKIGLESRAVEGGAAGLEVCRQEQIDLVLSDLKMSPMDGLEFLRQLRTIDAEVPVVILTAYGTISAAVDAMKLGAFDFVLKPFDREALEIVIRKALSVSRYQLENRFYREQLDEGGSFLDLVGRAPAMQPVNSSMSALVAASMSSSAITSETATRPPGRSTRAASAITFRLSPERLMTQLEITTSTLSAGSGIASISPRSHTTFSAPALRWFSRARASISSVMSRP